MLTSVQHAGDTNRYTGNGHVCDAVTVSGSSVSPPVAENLFVMHKPAGVKGVLHRDEARSRAAAASAGGVAAAATPERTLGDLVPQKWLTGDLGCYGRLDANTTGQ